jgi:hypothetical protein
MLRWLGANFFLLVIYGTFPIAAAIYVRGRITYEGVEQWPSVEATAVRETGSLLSGPNGGSKGGPSTIDSRSARFEYTVNGRTFTGDHFSPDGGGVQGPGPEDSWRAYYNPSSPEIAVLNPVPYKGYGAFAAAIVTGIMAGAHLYCAIGDFLNRRRRLNGSDRKEPSP